MISFRPTDEETAFVEVARDFAKTYIRPQARQCEEHRRVAQTLAAKATQLGFCGLDWPESLGGLGLPVISQVQVLEALTWGDLATVQGLPGTADAASFFRCTPDQPIVRSYADKIFDQRLPTAAFADATRPALTWEHGVTVRRNGKGLVIDGLTRPARLAASAEYVVLAALNEDLGPVILWLSRERTPWTVMEGDVRLGLLASGIARIQFDALQVSDEEVLASGDRAAHILEQALSRIRVFEAAKEVGTMGAALQYATTYTAQRKAFGREIAHFQGVSFLAADMAIQLQSARNLTWQAAAAIDQGDRDAPAAAERALSRAHAAMRFVTDNAVQLLGGSGYVQEYPVEKWMRDAEAQVMLYGRETELLADRGERLLAHAAGRDQA